jgi:plasmid maintenance system killer protein
MRGMRIIFAPIFLRQLKRLPKALQEEAMDAIEAFYDADNHASLKVHKLQGRFAKQYSFFVNYRFRIIFEYAALDVAYFLAIGDHDVYR